MPMWIARTNQAATAATPTQRHSSSADHPLNNNRLVLEVANLLVWLAI